MPQMGNHSCCCRCCAQGGCSLKPVRGCERSERCSAGISDPLLACLPSPCDPVRAAAGRTTATRCCCCACARPRRAAGACAPAAPALCPRRPTRARRCAAGRKVTSCGSAMPHTATSRRRRGPPSQSRSAPTARCSRPRSAPRTRARERPRGRMWHCCSTRIAGCDDAAAPRHLHSSASWWLPHSNS